MFSGTNDPWKNIVITHSGECETDPHSLAPSRSVAKQSPAHKRGSWLLRYLDQIGFQLFPILQSQVHQDGIGFVNDLLPLLLGTIFLEE